MERDTRSPVILATGAIAAILASACCAGPLVLLLLGVSGAWIGNLTRLEPYRPLFLALAIGALLLGQRRIFRPAAACAPGEVCATPVVRRTYRMLFIVVAFLLAFAIVFPWIAPLFT